MVTPTAGGGGGGGEEVLSQILSSIHICDTAMTVKRSKWMENGTFWSWWENSCQTLTTMVY